MNQRDTSGSSKGAVALDLRNPGITYNAQPRDIGFRGRASIGNGKRKGALHCRGRRRPRRCLGANQVSVSP